MFTKPNRAPYVSTRPYEFQNKWALCYSDILYTTFFFDVGWCHQVALHGAQNGIRRRRGWYVSPLWVSKQTGIVLFRYLVHQILLWCCVAPPGGTAWSPPPNQIQYWSRCNYPMSFITGGLGILHISCLQEPIYKKTAGSRWRHEVAPAGAHRLIRTSPTQDASTLWVSSWEVLAFFIYFVSKKNLLLHLVPPGGATWSSKSNQTQN